jgi:dihydrodipicolinate synthase/N-acetylneuraminate lyase
MEKKLHAIVVSITPFDEKGQLDENAYRLHLRRLADAGVSVFVGGGASGEGFSMTPDERDRVTEIAVEELKGKVPVRAMGFEPRHAGELVEFVRRTEKYKPDAIQIFSLDLGHAMKPNEAEMEKYYSTIIEATSCPIVLSSHMFSSGYLLPLDMIERLLDRFPSIVALNTGTPNTQYVAQMIRRFADRVEVHCAGPTNGLLVLMLGGNGFMGTEGNFAPVLVASVINAFKEGDLAEVRASFDKLLAFGAINERCGGGSAARAMKPLLNAYGLPGGTLRLPRIALGQEELQKMIKEVDALDIPGIPPLP